MDCTVRMVLEVPVFTPFVRVGCKIIWADEFGHLDEVLGQLLLRGSVVGRGYSLRWVGGEMTLLVTKDEYDPRPDALGQKRDGKIVLEPFGGGRADDI